MSWGSSVDWYDLVLQLGLRGNVSQGGQFYSRCPFHDDRSPSFSMNVENGLWYCHRDHHGGTFTDLAAEMLGVGRVEATQWILAHANTPSERVGTVVDLDELHDRQQTYYRSLADDQMCQWWFDRGFTWEDSEYWGVRYDPRADEVIFPLRFPWAGTWQGYIRRTFGGVAKYINTPTIPKRKLLYGYGQHRCAPAILLCEGPTDAIRARSAGYHALAALGSYISNDQLALLSSVDATRYILALDNDEAGWEGAASVLERWRIGGLWIFKYPDGVNDVGACTVEQIVNGVESADPAGRIIPRKRHK